MSESDWVALLEQGLHGWQRGELDFAVDSLEFCLSELKGQAQTELWQVLVGNTLGQLQLQVGLYEQSSNSRRLAREIWSAQRYEARWEEITPNIAWYISVLSLAGLDDEAKMHEASVAEGHSLFLGTDRSTPFGQTASRQGMTGVEDSDFQMPTLYAQKVGHRVIVGNWPNHLRDAISFAQLGRRQEMASELLEARAISVQTRSTDHGLRLYWTAWLECLCCFLVAEYAQSDSSRQETTELWLGLSVLKSVGESPDTMEILRILEEYQYDTLAARIREDLGRGKAPLIDPWRDLKVGFQSLGDLALEQSVEEQWREVVAECCESLANNRFLDVEAHIAKLKARLEGNKGQYELAGLLLEHLLCVVSQRRGNYSLASSLFTQCNKRWQEMSVLVKGEGPWVRVYQNLAAEAGCSFLLKSFPATLYDPEVDKHGMVRLEVAEEKAPEGELTWFRCLVNAWKAASSGKHDLAYRCAAQSEACARKAATVDLKLAVSLNTQSIIAHLMGNYQESLNLYAESVTVWRQEQMRGAAAVSDDFVEVLQQSGWDSLASKLRAKQRAKMPVLADPEEDLHTIQMGTWKDPNSAVAEETALQEMQTRQAQTRPKGFLAGIKGLFGKRERLDD